MSPPATGVGVSYHIIVAVSGSPTVFALGVWVYDPPRIDDVSPLVLRPDPNATLTIAGYNFGVVPGVVTVADTAAPCGVWTNEQLQCAAPRGVVASAVVRVFAASGSGSDATASPTVQYRYRPGLCAFFGMLVS